MANIKRADFRLFFLGVAMLLGLGAIVLRLWGLQVMDSDKYSKRVGGHSTVKVRIPSVRGEILDRNGVPLVQNRASYNVDFYLPDMVKGFHERHGSVPKVTEVRSIKGMPTDVEFPDILKIVNTGVVPRLQQLDLSRGYSQQRLKKHFDVNSLVPFTYIEDVDFPTIAKFSEHDVGLPGVDIMVKPVRQYLYGAFASHILGYVGMPRNYDQLPDVKQYHFYQPDVEGKSQIEKAMDVYLRGEPGVRIMRRSAKGIMEGEMETVAPKAGANVYLTIDAQIQYITEVALRHPTVGRAAAVVMDPKNGDILAMASVPSFDPNVFIPSIKPDDWKMLLKDETVPLVNRAVSGFPPGSTYKIITAMAGLTKGIGLKKFNCSGGMQYGNHYFKCWISGKGSHGSLALSDALKVSCNAFFYQYGNDAGGAAIEKVANLLGMGQINEHLGLSDQRAGTNPGPERRYALTGSKSWTSADTANIAIGQGEVQASPLQMAAAYAMVANGGTAFEPRLIKKVLWPDGKPVLDADGKVAVPDEPVVRGDWHGSLSPEQIEEVRTGLWKVVNQTGGPGGSGTGSRGKVPGVVVAGKTGTAQASDRGVSEHIAWFCCFAPFDNPRYTVVVMVQAGEHGGSVAAPIASHILEECFALEKGAKVAMKPLAPARGKTPFTPIEALPPYSGQVAVFTNDDQSDTVHEGQEGSVQMAPPDIAVEKPEEPDPVPRAVPANEVRSTPQNRGRNTVVGNPAPARPRTDNNIFRKLFERKPKQAPTPRRGGRP